MTRILITGANGFLGQHLCHYFDQPGYAVIATGRGSCRITLAEGHIYEEVELTDKEAVQKLIKKHLPDVIIHNAAMSKPDECETNKAGCLEANVEATKNLLKAASAFFIYVSTDFIYGEDGPHSEAEKPQPLNFYGESKLMAEMQVKGSEVDTAIIRPVFIYGSQFAGSRPSFLHWVKNNLEQGRKIKVVSDQQRTPTYAPDICSGIEAIILHKVTGDFNLAGKDIISPYEMAITTAKELGLDVSLIEKVTSETFPEPVRRAKRSGLKIEKAQQVLGYSPVSFREGVRLTFELT